MIGQGIKTIRKMRGYTQEVLAGRCGISAPMISRYEHNVQAPSKKMIGRIAEGLDAHPIAIAWYATAVDAEDDLMLQDNKDLYFIMRPSIDELINKLFIYESKTK